MQLRASTKTTENPTGADQSTKRGSDARGYLFTGRRGQEAEAGPQRHAWLWRCRPEGGHGIGSGDGPRRRRGGDHPVHDGRSNGTLCHVPFAHSQLESIAIDGYLADLPLSTFVHNLPFTAPPPEAGLNFNPDDFSTAAEMDQHTTSALRDAIFSLNESSGHTVDQTAGADQQENHDDQHLALLDLSHAMPGDEPGEGGTDGLHLNLPYNSCAHSPLVPHILSLLTQHSLDPKPGSNTPLNLEVFAPLARSLRLFGAITSCVHCMSSVQQTLPQLALLSRTTTILTFPYPPITSASGAQITLHGARLTGTGLSEAIEQHIVGVVWDSWRASVREIFTGFERKAQDVITSSALMAANQNTDGENQNQGSAPSSAETQRAGLIFQAMSRLVTAMDEVEER